MNTLEIGVALIRRIEQEIQWLGIHNQTKHQIDFVIAHRLEKESWRDSVTREVAWQLDLDRNRDIVVSNMAQLNVEFEAALPGETDSTQIACAFYNVQLYRKAAREKISADENYLWLSCDEILAGQTEAGVVISPMLMLLNGHAKVIRHEAIE